MKTYHQSCYGLKEIEAETIDALITDPPYGISFKGHYWDKDLPNPAIWADALRVLKPGAFGLVFSSIRLQHRLTVQLEDAGFMIKDVLLWGFLNGMPKSRDVGLEIDKSLGVKSEKVGEYKYVQGYKKDTDTTYYAGEAKAIQAPASELGKKYRGFGNGIKPAYEPIILIQKPFDGKVADNIIRHGVGGLNLEETRLPYSADDGKVGHNPHPVGRVMANILRDEEFGDGYDKFFLVPKVRQAKDAFNSHPTLKPTHLMRHLIKLLTVQGQTVLDPFMGSGSTGVAALETGRDFIGYELEEEYFRIAQRRFAAAQKEVAELS
ncbi:DNA-methyltransferase [Deinococcus arenicola]|uniref:Methyltransferase n=1 Tax=Deinococcus arenicola TaxID=2994950 RepID=A0ABU4DSK7_9DEIO|nr:site-specific DNA-methyltransferase [Deinococcus sp. ZS9-10]MDV6375074.1 site-specific DNA-methyltransferase [Deinococcus sp. ZS9-10]